MQSNQRNNMKNRIFGILIAIIILNLVASDGEHASIKWDIESACNGVCNCTQTKDDIMESSEFRAACEGNGRQVLLLSENLFKEEPIPDTTRKIYVRVSNQSRVIVTEGFLAKWKSYKSCSLDFWYNSNIDFPRICPDMADSNAISHISIGIAIVYSKTDGLPRGLYGEKDKASLLFQKATILNLDLQGIFGTTPVGSLTITNTTIGTIQGESDHRPLFLSRKGIFKIVDSQIGQILRNGLHLRPGSYAKPVVSIDKTSIGIIDPNGISLLDNIELRITNSYIGEVHPNAMIFSNGPRVVAKNNKFGVHQQFLSNVSCINSRNVIENNMLIPLDSLKCKDSADTGEVLINIEDYVDLSCKENCLYADKPPPIPQSLPIIVTYGTMGLCLILVALVAGLSGALMWIYIFRYERKRKNSDGVSSVYFAPNNIQRTELADLNPQQKYIPTRRPSTLSFIYSPGMPESAFTENQLDDEYF